MEITSVSSRKINITVAAYSDCQNQPLDHAAFIFYTLNLFDALQLA